MSRYSSTILASYCWLYLVTRKNHYFSGIIEKAMNTLQKAVCQYLALVMRNGFSETFGIKNKRIEKIEFKPFKVEQMVRDLYLNHNIEVLPQAEGSENDIELMKTLKEMFGEAIRTHYYISK